MTPHSQETTFYKKKDKEKEVKEKKKIEDPEEIRKREQNERRIKEKTLKDLKADEVELLALIEFREFMQS